MDDKVTGVLPEVVKNTNSELILFFVVAAVVLLVLTIPTYRMIVKAREKKRQQYMDRDKEDRKIFLDVIKENTQASTKLATVLERIDKNCSECKAEQVALFHEINNKQDTTIIAVKEVHTILEERLDRRMRLVPVDEERRKP